MQSNLYAPFLFAHIVRTAYSMISITDISHSIWLDVKNDTWNTNNFEVACSLIRNPKHNVQLSLGFAFKGHKELFTIMPKKSNNQEKRADWRGFVNINLSYDDKSDFDGWKKKNDKHFDQMIHELVIDGHKLTISWDKKSECFMSIMRNDVDGHVNGGLCITSRSTDLSEALWLALYKHYEITGEDWSQYFKNPSTRQWG